MRAFPAPVHDRPSVLVPGDDVATSIGGLISVSNTLQFLLRNDRRDLIRIVGAPTLTARGDHRARTIRCTYQRSDHSRVDRSAHATGPFNSITNGSSGLVRAILDAIGIADDERCRPLSGSVGPAVRRLMKTPEFVSATTSRSRRGPRRSKCTPCGPDRARYDARRPALETLPRSAGTFCPA
jgi:hypothetical protein